jgi:hypothetical protein
VQLEHEVERAAIVSEEKTKDKDRDVDAPLLTPDRQVTQLKAALTSRHNQESSARAALQFKEKTVALKAMCDQINAEHQKELVRSCLYGMLLAGYLILKLHQ